MTSTVWSKLAYWWLGSVAAPPPPSRWERGWREALDSTCRVLEDTSATIESIELRGERRALTSPGRIFALIDLTRDVSADHDVEAQVSFPTDTPVVHLARRS